MRSIYPAISIVAPSGSYIAEGIKTLEIRSWRPNELPLKDLVIVENAHDLNQDGDEELGRAVAWGVFHLFMLGKKVRLKWLKQTIGKMAIGLGSLKMLGPFILLWIYQLEERFIG